MPALVYGIWGTMACIIGANIYGTALLMTAPGPCIALPDFESTGIDQRVLLRALVICTWVAIGLFFLVVYLVLNVYPATRGRTYSDSCGARCSSWSCCLCFHGRFTASADGAAGKQMGSGFSGCAAEEGGETVYHSRRPPVQHIAAIMEAVFAKAQLTASDCVAAFALVGTRHRLEKMSLKASPFSVGEGLLSQMAKAEAGSVPVVAHRYELPTAPKAGQPDGAAGSVLDPQAHVPLPVLEELEYYHKYVDAVYGFIMHAWYNRRTPHRLCNVCFCRGCGCCCRHRKYQVEGAAGCGPALQPLDRMNREAIQQVGTRLTALWPAGFAVHVAVQWLGFVVSGCSAYIIQSNFSQEVWCFSNTCVGCISCSYLSITRKCAHLLAVNAEPGLTASLPLICVPLTTAADSGHQGRAPGPCGLQRQPGGRAAALHRFGPPDPSRCVGDTRDP